MAQIQTTKEQATGLENVNLLSWRWKRVEAEKREGDVNREILRRMH